MVGGNFPLDILSEVGDIEGLIRGVIWRQGAGRGGRVFEGYPYPGIIRSVVAFLLNRGVGRVLCCLSCTFVRHLISHHTNVRPDLVEVRFLSPVSSSLQGFKSLVKDGKMFAVAQGPRVIEDPPDEVKGATAVRVDV